MPNAGLAVLNRPINSLRVTSTIKVTITKKFDSKTVIEEWQETKSWTTSAYARSGATTDVA